VRGPTPADGARKALPGGNAWSAANPLAKDLQRQQQHNHNSPSPASAIAAQHQAPAYVPASSSTPSSAAPPSASGDGWDSPPSNMPAIADAANDVNADAGARDTGDASTTQRSSTSRGARGGRGGQHAKNKLNAAAAQQHQQHQQHQHQLAAAQQAPSQPQPQPQPQHQQHQQHQLTDHSAPSNAAAITNPATSGVADGASARAAPMAPASSLFSVAGGGRAGTVGTGAKISTMSSSWLPIGSAVAGGAAAGGGSAALPTASMAPLGGAISFGSFGASALASQPGASAFGCVPPSSTSTAPSAAPARDSSHTTATANSTGPSAAPSHMDVSAQLQMVMGGAPSAQSTAQAEAAPTWSRDQAATNGGSGAHGVSSWASPAQQNGHSKLTMATSAADTASSRLMAADMPDSSGLGPARSHLQANVTASATMAASSAPYPSSLGNADASSAQATGAVYAKTTSAGATVNALAAQHQHAAQAQQLQQQMQQQMLQQQQASHSLGMDLGSSSAMQGSFMPTQSTQMNTAQQQMNSQHAAQAAYYNMGNSPVYYGNGAAFVPSYGQMGAYNQAAMAAYGQGPAMAFTGQHHAQTGARMPAAAYTPQQGGKAFAGQGKTATYNEYQQVPAGGYGFGAPAYHPSSGATMPNGLGAVPAYAPSFDGFNGSAQATSYAGYDMLASDFHAQQMYMQGGRPGMYPPGA